MDIKSSKLPVKEKEAVNQLHNTSKQKLWIGSYLLFGINFLLLYFLMRFSIPGV